MFPRAASWLPDGKSLVFSRNGADKVKVVIRNVNSGDERVLIERPSLGGPSVSPDGRQIAYIIQDRVNRVSTLNTMPVEGGDSTELGRITGPASLNNLTVWTPDGRSILFARTEHDTNSVWIVPSTGGTARKLDLDLYGNGSLRLHPDGRRIAYNTGVTTIEIWTLENFLPPAIATSTKR